MRPRRMWRPSPPGGLGKVPRRYTPPPREPVGQLRPEADTPHPGLGTWAARHGAMGPVKQGPLQTVCASVGITLPRVQARGQDAGLYSPQ